MMNTLEEFVAYIVKTYPYPGELSNARVTKMLYLADWHSLINGSEALTDIHWYFDNYGPFVWDVKRCVENSAILNVRETKTIFGNKKELIELLDKNYEPDLSASTKKSLDYIIKQTKNLNWSSFIRLVYSTYPIARSEKYSQLDLPSLARDYRINQQI